MARSIVQECIEKKQLHFNKKMSGDYLSFFLMPFRHEKPVSIKRMEMIVDVCNSVQKRIESEKNALAKFKRVTENKLAEALLEMKNKQEEEEEEEEVVKVIKDEDILEPHPVITKPIADKKEHSLYKLVKNFVLKEEEQNPNTPFVVSLSGGVDSMVLMTLLCFLTKKKVIACHVNYGNRREADAEADFVQRYCKEFNVAFNCVRGKDVK